MDNEAPVSTESTESAAFEARALSVSMTVKDLPQSLAWYRDVIGFTLEREYERDGKLMGGVLKAGEIRILLNQDDGAKGMDRTKGEGFSLQLTTAQNVDDIANRIKESGGTLDSEPADMPWGVRAFRFRDPDGFRVAISTERPD